MSQNTCNKTIALNSTHLPVGLKSPFQAFAENVVTVTLYESIIIMLTNISDTQPNGLSLF